MKKFIFILIALFFTYTNANSQMSGNYTIGGVAPDFISLDSALYYLGTQGASDTVIFNIRPGNYSSKSVRFYQINTSFPVIFQSESLDSSSVIIRVSAFFNCTNVTVNALTIYPNSGTSTGGGYPYRGMEICASSYITIKNCAFVNKGSTNNAISIIKANSHSLINNSFVGFNHAISISSMTYYGSNMHLGNNIISGCIIDSCDVGIRVMGRIMNSLEISYNTIKNCGGGIYLDGSSQFIDYTDIHHNVIYNTDGYCINSVNNNYSTSINIYNNMLSGGKNWEVNFYNAAGHIHMFILISVNLESSKSIKFINNSVAGCVFLDGSNSIQIKNNCLSSDSSILLYVNSSCSNITSDYNNFYNSDSSYIVLYSSDWINDIDSLRNYGSNDAHSVSTDPVFNNKDNDLHATHPLLQFAGISTSLITDDIDGESRSITPDIGADEFNSSPLPPFAYFSAVAPNDDRLMDFTDMTVRPGTYLWDFGDGNSSTASSPSHTYSQYGTYYVTLTATNNYGSHQWSDSIYVLDYTAIKKSKNNDLNLSIYPNPSNGRLNIDLGVMHKGIKVKIRNVLGQNVSEFEFENVDHFNIFIEGEKSIYFVEILSTNGKSAFRKVLKN